MYVCIYVYCLLFVCLGIYVSFDSYQNFLLHSVLMIAPWAPRPFQTFIILFTGCCCWFYIWVRVFVPLDRLGVYLPWTYMVLQAFCFYPMVGGYSLLFPLNPVHVFMLLLPFLGNDILIKFIPEPFATLLRCFFMVLWSFFLSVSPCNVFLALQCSLHGFFLHHYLGIQLVSIDLLSPGFWLLFVRALEILAVYLTCFPSCFMPMFSICLVWAIPIVHGEVIASGVFFPFNSSLSIGKSLILFILPCYGFKWKPTPGGSIIPLQYVGLGPVFHIVAFFLFQALLESG